MALVYKDRVKQVCSAPTTTNPFDFTGAATSTGYQTFVAALADGETCVYAAEDADGDWEVGLGTWTEASDQLARTTILASSNAGSAETFSGDTTVYITQDASRSQSSYEAHSAITPGGRLTLTTATPVTTADVTGATTVYYTPYVHDRIALWTGAYWKVVQFAETSHALGTVTSGKPYDVFAYLDAGALALEKLVWTDDTTRATAITLQDGRYCKSGDKTRLYLGTFYTTSTTATEDSLTNRYVFNAYNQVMRGLNLDCSGGIHTYSTDAYREWGNTTNRIRFVIGLPAFISYASLSRIYGNSGTFTTHIGLNAVDDSGGCQFIKGIAGDSDLGGEGGNVSMFSSGRHELVAVQRSWSATTATYFSNSIRSEVQA